MSGVCRKARYNTPVKPDRRVFVFDRQCDAYPKPGLLRWMQTVNPPQISVASFTHQCLLRNLGTLMNHQAALDEVVANLLLSMWGQAFFSVFFGFTTPRMTSLSVNVGTFKKLTCCYSASQGAIQTSLNELQGNGCNFVEATAMLQITGPIAACFMYRFRPFDSIIHATRRSCAGRSGV